MMRRLNNIFAKNAGHIDHTLHQVLARPRNVHYEGRGCFQCIDDNESTTFDFSTDA